MSAANEPISARQPVRPQHRLVVGGGTRSSSPASSSPEQGASPPLLQRPESFRESAGIGSSRTAEQGSGAESQAVNQPQPTYSGLGSSGGIRQHLRRWLCAWVCFGARVGSTAGRIKRRAGQRAQQLPRSATPQAGSLGSPSNSLGGPSRRSHVSVTERTEASSGGLLATGANSTGGSSDSHVGPLPSRQLHLHGSQDGGSGRLPSLSADVAGGGGPAAAIVTGTKQAVQPLSGRSTTTPSSNSNMSSLNSGRDTMLPDMFPGASGGPGPVGGSTFVAAGSRASSVASYASGGTTTSRPSRWGLLAGILSAGLRSLSTQLAGVVEPDTGNLSLAAVQDLTRRASCLDVLRAAGQVCDLTLIGAGSMGLVYRGRILNPPNGGGGSSGDDGGSGGGTTTIAIKYLVARGTDGMAAPATEGLLSRALAHPNIIATFSWHVTRITPDNFLELPEALAAVAAREQRKAAAAATVKHGRRGGGKGRRTGGAGGSGLFAVNSSALRPGPQPTAAGPSAAATAMATSRCRPSSTTLLPTVVLGVSITGGGAGPAGGDSRGCGGSDMSWAVSVGPEGRGGPREGRTRDGRAASATFTTNVLDMIRASAVAGALVPRTRPVSPGGSPLTRLVLSRHRSFTASTARSRVPSVLPLLRASATPGETGTSRLGPLPPGQTAPVPVPLPGGAHQAHHHEQQQQGDKQDPQMQERRDRQQGRGPPAESEASLSAARTEFFRLSDVPSSNIFPSLVPGDGAVAPVVDGAGGAAAPAAAAATVMPGAATTTRNSGTIASFFSRDSAGSIWFGPSPNTSNHAHMLGGALLLAQRSTTLGVASGGDGGSLMTGIPVSYQQGFGLQQGAAAAGPQAPLEDNAVGAAASTPPPPPQQPSPPLLAGGPAAALAGRVRNTLVRAGSRLQVATTLNTQPSIPEDIQAMDFVSSYGEYTFTSTVIQTDSREPGMRLLNSLVAAGGAASSGVEPQEVGSSLPTIGPGSAGGGLLCVAPPAEAAAATAAVASAEPPPPKNPSPASSRGSGGRSARSVGSTVLSACCMGPASSRKPLQFRGEHDSHPGGNSPSDSRVGLLAAALGAESTSPSRDKSQSPTQSQSNGHTNHSRSQVATSSSGFCSGSNGRPAATPKLPLLLPQQSMVLQPMQAASPRPLVGVAVRPLPSLRSGGGGGSVAGLGPGQSRTDSTVFTRSTTVSSAKRLSSAVISPNLAQILGSGPAAGTGLGGVTGSVMTCSAMDLTRSANGSSAVAVGSGSATGAVVATGSGSVDTGASPAAQAVAANEADVVRQEVLERGWQTMQQIMQRLNARPGDYLTRIVMEDADQGSLLMALRSGRFGTEDEGLRSLLLTALDIARGMAFLHRHNVIHGDLKPSNVLLCSNPTDPRGFIAKVSDLGLSRIITRDNEFVQNRESFPVGTVRYLAPEAVRGSSFKASDVWSYAVVLWQLVTGEQAPWPGLRSMQIVMGVMQNELQLAVPPTVYPPLASLIQSCLAHDHKARPSFDEIVECVEAMLRDVVRPIQRSKVLQRPADAADADEAAADTYMASQEPLPGAMALTLAGNAAAFETLPLDSPAPAVFATSALISDLPAATAAAPPSAPPSVAVSSLDLGADDPDPLFGDALADAGLGRGPGSGSLSGRAAAVPGAATDARLLTPLASPPERQRTATAVSVDPAAAAAATAAASITAAAGSGAGSSFVTARCFAGTSVSLTGAASSSNALTQISGSWVQTGTTTTTRTTNVLMLADRDGRGSCSSSANAATIMALHGSAGHLGLATGGGASVGAIASGGLGGQETLQRPRTFLGAMLPDDVLGGTARRGGTVGAAAMQLPVGVSAITAGGSDSLDVSGLRVSVMGDLNQQFLEPVHEEQPPTSSSGMQTVVNHGSAQSSDVARLSAGATGTFGATTGCGAARGAGSSNGAGGGSVGGGSRDDRPVVTMTSAGPAPGSDLSCQGLSGGVSALPRMLQAGLIVLGQRESVSGQSVPSSRSVPQASPPSSGRLEDDPDAQQQQQQQQRRELHGSMDSAQEQHQPQVVLGPARRRRRSVLSLESLPMVANPYSRLSGRSD